MNKKTKITVSILFVLLLLFLFVLTYFFIKPKYFLSKTNDNPIRNSLETNLAILYFVESHVEDDTVSLGINFINGQEIEYEIVNIEVDRFEGDSLVAVAHSSLPSYVSISKDSDDKYVISIRDEKEINNSVLSDFSKKLYTYLYTFEDPNPHPLKQYQKMWLAAYGYMKFPDDNSKKECADYPKQYESLNNPDDLINVKEFGEDQSTYITNYARNYPYSCLVSKALSESGVTSRNYDTQLCNLPEIPTIDKNKFGIENIESIWGSDRKTLKEENGNINSTTLLIDYWAKGESNLENAYRYSLSEAYKFGMTKEDTCYWMLVNDLTSYKNNLYNYIIHDASLFNGFNSMYCPSLHMPLQFKYIKEPKNLDVNYFVFDL